MPKKEFTVLPGIPWIGPDGVWTYAGGASVEGVGGGGHPLHTAEAADEIVTVLPAMAMVF